jgi:YVTN family beta-propeller protein
MRILLGLLISVAAIAQQPPLKVGHPTFLSPHARPIVANETMVFVVNTPADTVDVIDRKTHKIVARIPVGIDPVGLALRPDGRELWVSNHISDTISVIDLDPKSAFLLEVVATIQDLDHKTKTTNFDEPVGIAFASNEKAYVALSTTNRIAVVDVNSRKILRHLPLRVQEPRAIVVRNERLYVIPFESNNKTQLSGGNGSHRIDGKLITYDAAKSVRENNVLSKGHVEDVVKAPRFPDRDLIVFDTRTDRQITSVETLGTLLYGLAVDSRGRVFIAQTDARNDANGKAGTMRHGLKEMENRAFLNQITKVALNGSPRRQFFDLEPRPPQQPERGTALATPFAIQVSGDDKTLFATAAGSDVFFSVDAESGRILDRIRVGAVPRGIALMDREAWIFNAVDNSVYLADVSNPEKLKALAKVQLDDPTPEGFKRGRALFNSAKASTTETFSCASCHPDGHTDQLLWVLDTPIVTGGTQIQPRVTMPVRGLRDTAPFHWDGIPGDPYGGNNSANLHGYDKPNCDVDDPISQIRVLVDGGLATTMMLVGSKEQNDERKAGRFSKAERDALSKFLLNVPYPPAQKRAYTNELSKRAEEGFELFHVTGNYEGKPQPNVCGDCHRMPFYVSTNTPGENGMDAPTWRGAIDRFLLTPQGRANVMDLPHFAGFANAGFPELPGWKGSWKGRKRFDPVESMIVEMTNGRSGAFARQLTINRDTVTDSANLDLLVALERASSEGAVVLQMEGAFLIDGRVVHMSFQYDASVPGGTYRRVKPKRYAFTRDKLLEMAKKGELIATFTGRHGANAYGAQPAIWTLGSIHEQRGSQIFPRVHDKKKTMTLSGRHVSPKAHVIVNGRRASATVQLGKNETIQVTLSRLPAKGLNFLQLQNPGGSFSNELLFFVETPAESIARKKKEPRGLLDAQLWSAIINGDLEEAKLSVEAGASISEPNVHKMKPLSYAAFYGRTDIVEYLLDKGASLHEANEDGNTALIWAAAFGHEEITKALLKRGADPHRKNKGGHNAIEMSWGYPDGIAKMFEEFRTKPWFIALPVDVEAIKKGREKTHRLVTKK